MKREYIRTVNSGVDVSIALYHVSGGIMCVKLQDPLCGIVITSLGLDGRDVRQRSFAFRGALTMRLEQGRHTIHSTRDVYVYQSAFEQLDPSVLHADFYLIRADHSILVVVGGQDVLPAYFHFSHFSQIAL